MTKSANNIEKRRRQWSIYKITKKESDNNKIQETEKYSPKRKTQI